MDMEFKATKVSDELLPEGVTQLFQGHIVKSDAISSADLAERVAERLKIDVSLVKSIVGAVGRELIDSVRSGERPVMDKVFTTKFTCLGTFESEDDVWDASRNSLGVAFITLDAVKNALADVVPTNVLSKVNIQLLGAQDATTLEQNSLTIGNTLLGQGKNIKVTTANADEGIYLIKGANVYKGTVVNNTQGTIDATFPSTMEPGEGYTLELRGRAGNGTNRSLVTARISDFTVKAAS